MSTKIIATAAFSAVAFFALGAYVGLDYTTSQPLPPPPETPLQTQKIASLRGQNERLRAEVDRLAALNSSLSKSRIAPTAAPAPAQPSPEAFQTVRTVSQQKAMLNNLRQIAAARDQFQLENGRPPASMDELVGETKYIRRLNPVDGESYAGLSLFQGSPLTVTTLNGVSVTYDPAGGGTTNIQSPPPTPEMARLMEMTQRLMPAIKSAVEAYRAAHDGATPSNTNPEALIPYFSTPQEGADFVEFIGAQKAAGR
jgi:type IV pilus assembly protein PilA